MAGLISGQNLDDLTLKYIIDKEVENGGGGGSQADIDAIKAEIGTTPLPTTAQTLSGAIAELDGDISGKVSKSGDTMTGLLNLSTSALNGLKLTHTTMEKGVAPSDALYKYITFKDKNDADLAVIYARINTSGNIALRVGTHVGSVYNTVTFTINPSTDARSISLDDAAAWLKALGLGSSGELPITIAQGGSGQTAVTKTATASDILTAASNRSITTAQYAQWGKVAMVRLTIKTTAAVSGDNQTWGTIKSGKRPAYEAGGEVIGDGNTITHVTIGTDGVIKTNGSVGANSSIYIHATYILA